MNSDTRKLITILFVLVAGIYWLRGSNSGTPQGLESARKSNRPDQWDLTNLTQSRIRASDATFVPKAPAGEETSTAMARLEESKPKDPEKKDETKKKKKKKKSKNDPAAPKSEGTDNRDEDETQIARNSRRGGMVGSVNPGWSDGRRVTAEQWLRYLEAAPGDTRRVEELVTAYREGEITSEVFYSVVGALARTLDERLQNSAITALSLTPSKESFRVLVEFQEAAYPQSPLARQQVDIALDSYALQGRAEVLSALLSPSEEAAVLEEALVQTQALVGAPRNRSIASGRLMRRFDRARAQALRTNNRYDFLRSPLSQLSANASVDPGARDLANAILRALEPAPAPQLPPSRRPVNPTT